MTDLMKIVKKFGGSAHIILPKTLIGEKVRIRTLNIDETRQFDKQKLIYDIAKLEDELFDFQHSSKIYKRRLGNNYEKLMEMKIKELKDKLEEFPIETETETGNENRIEDLRLKIKDKKETIKRISERKDIRHDEDNRSAIKFHLIKIEEMENQISIMNQT